MGNRKTIVVTTYGHNRTIDKIAVSSFEVSENSYYNQGSDAKTYCDTINSLELKGDFWIFAKILSENTQDLFNNRQDDRIMAWEVKKRRRMPRRFFLSGCTG